MKSWPAHLSLIMAILVAGVVSLVVPGFIPDYLISPVWAQETTQTPDQPEANDQLETLSSQYRAQLDAYRRIQREHDLSWRQYEQLETLTALDELIQKTRELMLQRNQIFETYFQIQQLRLDQQQGISTGLRQLGKDELATAQRQLAIATAQLETAQTRDEVAAAEELFAGNITQFEKAGYLSLSILAYADVAEVSSQTGTLLDELTAESADNGNLAQARRNRVEADTTRSYQETTQELAAIEQDLIAAADGGRDDDRYYERTVEDLERVSTQLSQVLAFMRELL